MSHRTSPQIAARTSTAARRGVSSILAMMAMVILSSLCAAMAVVAQGNLRTADAHLKFSRAMSAAETGLNFAARRLAAQTRRFVTDKGVIDEAYGQKLWDGTYTAGSVTVLPPPDGYAETPPALGIAQAVLNAHKLFDLDSFDADSADASLPTLSGGVVRCKPIALTRDANGSPNAAGPHFRLRYESVVGTNDSSYVRVTCRGVDSELHRTLQMDFKIDKKIEFAVVSPSRIMIGKNVRVEGPMGTRFGLVGTCSDTPPGELCSANGDPVVMRSDFYYLDPTNGTDAGLNHNLNIFFPALAANDADGDGRLRVYHDTEKIGLQADPVILNDYDENEFVDDFDLFLDYFDTNPVDKSVVYDTVKANLYYGGSHTQEFSADTQLGRLIDQADPDRDDDGQVLLSDHLLGYDDGMLDIKDNYAKVKGRLLFAVTRDEWEVANGASYQTVVHGPIVSGLDTAPVTFEASDEELRDLTTDMFQTSQTWFKAQVPASFTMAQLIAATTAGGGTYVAPSNGPAPPSTWEDIPYGAPGAYDYIKRPQFKNAKYTNLRIPRGCNGLFDNCTFIGVTYIETYTHCTDDLWNYTGAVDNAHALKYPTAKSSLNPPSQAPADLVNDTKPYSNALRFNKCTFVGSISGDKPEVYTHWRNKWQFTGNTRFYINALDPDLLTQSDAAIILGYINAMSVEAITELSKSSILAPGLSLDIGNFTNDQNADPLLTPKVKLKGTIVAGIMDVRGTADIFGTMLNTYHPVAGLGPLHFGGLTDAFNATIGYFGPADGDGEGDNVVANGYGEITLRYDKNALLPDGIPWAVRAEADPLTYFEGGTL